MTAYDAALTAAPSQAERDRLRELRLRFDTPPDSPEWVFYATLAPLMDGPGETIAEEVQAAVVQGARSAGRELCSCLA